MQLGVRLEGKSGKRKEVAECLLDFDAHQDQLANDANDPASAADPSQPVELSVGLAQK